MESQVRDGVGLIRMTMVEVVRSGQNWGYFVGKVNRIYWFFGYKFDEKRVIKIDFQFLGI